MPAITAVTPEGTRHPLDRVTVSLNGDAGGVVVRDSRGVEYARLPARRKVSFTVSGAQGTQWIQVEDGEGHLLEMRPFEVHCETDIEDKGGQYAALLQTLRWNIVKGREPKVTKWQGQVYRLFSDWIRDHTHILKGKKYFAPELRDAVELFAQTQREDGMVFDLLSPHAADSTFAENRFRDPANVRVSEDREWYLQRVPAENDVEYLFVQALHSTWKATGDSEWMERYLPHAARAMEYSRADALRWSKKYGLLKRAFTIDTWDFQPHEDSMRVGDTMDIDEEITDFGIFHGDNTGYAESCGFLAEMLAASGKEKEAAEWERFGQTIRKRLDKVSWNGKFFTHHIPEDPKVERDLGADQDKQVSLSNALALNRGIPHDQAVAILKTYQRIRKTMPSSSAGEFYGIYPPFTKSFTRHMLPWHYVNGGVFGFIAGELARGALSHGFEEYGADVLMRMKDLLDRQHGEMPYYWLGKIEEAPKRSFTSIDLKGEMNCDVSGKGAPGVPGWTGQGTENDFSRMPTGKRRFQDIPFHVIDPAKNKRRACIALAKREGYRLEAEVPVGKKAASLYFLHTLAGGGMVGWVTLEYADGTTARVYVNAGAAVKNWWDPTDVPYNRREGWRCKVAWRGHNGKCDVGCYVWGLDNPQPHKTIRAVRLTHGEGPCTWFVLGLTLCDKPVFFTPADHCGTWLVNWNSAGLVCAMIEGLAGVKDEGLAYDRVRLSPRWSAAGVDRVTATAVYAASGAYVRYRYRHNKAKETLELEIAGCAEETTLSALLPNGARVREVSVDGENVAFEETRVERSRYVEVKIRGLAAHKVVIGLRGMKKRS